MTDLGYFRDGDRIVIELDPGRPVELEDLSGSFASLARIYGRHYRQQDQEAPKLYVTRLETGSVIMEVAPLAVLMGALTVMDNGIVVADFTNRLFRAIKAFSGGPEDLPQVDPPSDDDARDIREFTRPLLGNKGASLGIKHARYERTDGERSTVVAYTFDETELNRAALNIEKTLALPAPPELSTRKRHQLRQEVMLFMEQASRKPGKEAGRTGDRGVIPEVCERALPVWFHSSAPGAKDQVTREVNPLTSTIVVDVYVQTIDDEPKGYIVTKVHSAFPEEA